MQRDQIDRLVWSLPVADRLTLLTLSVIQQNPNALRVSLNMLGVLMKLSRGLGTENRFALAEAMRDAADKLERCHAVHIGSN
jgi:hypothetical protein